jgi:glycosyltransferase involved in cell wall biosynthesis
VKIKCLHISANSYPPLNGKHHFTKEIWFELAKGFDEYHILARSENNRYSFTNEKNIYLHLLPKLSSKSKLFFFTSFWMFRIISKYQISHLLSQCPILGGFAATLASKYYKIPLMVEINGREYIRWDETNAYFGLLKKMQNFVFKNASKVRFPNNEIKKYLISLDFFVNSVYIPHRVNHELFNKQKSNFEIGEILNIVSVGRFVWEKDYLFLIDTFMSVNFPIRLTLIGGGELEQEYIRLYSSRISKLDLVLIKFLSQNELINLVINCDIYIQSSVSETGPRTLLEAMALQMPILSSNIGIFSDIIEYSKCGIMFEARNKNDLLLKLNSLIESIEIRSEISKNGYFISKEKYSWNKCFDIYREELLSMNN